MLDANEMIELINRRAERGLREKAIYLDSADKLYHCSVCREPVQARISIAGQERTVWAACSCVTKQRDAGMESIKAQYRERRRRYCFDGDTKLMASDFAADDSPETRLSQISHRYAETFGRGSDWLLLSGGTGAGKTFYASCICNAVIDAGKTAVMVRISDLSRKLWNAQDKQSVFSALDRADLLVVDDLGEARDTGYMNEIAFTVFDNRLRRDLPCVITTNLTPEQLMESKSADFRRVSSRIAEKAVPVHCNGEDRRVRSLLDSGNDRLRRMMGDG